VFRGLMSRICIPPRLTLLKRFASVIVLVFVL
jgi:hypothetical protein